MKNKIGCLILLSALAISEPALAVSAQGRNALNAFRRYEPEFSNVLRDLQELDRKLAKIEDDENLSKTSEIWLKAEKLMAKVEESYDSMEDLYNVTLSRNPGDQAELREGFNRLDDLYRKVRDFYTEKYTYRGEDEAGKAVGKTSEEISGQDKSAAVPGNKGNEPYSYYVEPLKAEEYNLVLAADQDMDSRKINVTGKLIFETRNADEKHESLNSSTPNDNTQGRLLLTYELDENRELSFEEKYLIRERNEKIKENHFTLSYFTKHGDDSAFTLRDKLEHIWYPDDSDKNYRTNTLEGIYTKSYSHEHERVVAAYIKSKRYSANSKSDYDEYSIKDEETWNKRNTNIFAEVKSDFVRYNNVGNLDYDNYNAYVGLDKSYSGNKAQLKVANTYDRRTYDIESVTAYRTNYYDNFLQVGYGLPINDNLTYNFEGEYTKHEFASDEPRGYSSVDLFNEFCIKADDRNYIYSDYRYVYNDENTRSSAHKNNITHIGWTKNVNKDYRIALDGTYHDRNSVENPALDFKANTLAAELSWKLKNNHRLGWNTEHYLRRYDNISLGVADYRYLESGLDYSFSKRKAYDWKVAQKWRKIEYRNWGGVPTDWVDRVQPVTEVKYGKWLSDELRLIVKATWEKTYYREYNNDSQELEYKFNDLMYNKEFYASLEYIF